MQNIDQIKEEIKKFERDDFSFNEEFHAYSLKGRKMKSVTTYLKNFSEPFDADYWSRKKALQRLDDNKEEVTKESLDNMQSVIQKEWKDKADYACDMGTEVHLYLEEYFGGMDITPFKHNESKIRVDKFKNIYDSKLHVMESVAQELRIFSETMGLAGTIDALFMRNGQLEIWDYKTNGSIKTDKDYCFNKLKPPFQNEWENELNKYSIQLNLYKLMLAEHGIKANTCGIIYLPPNTIDKNGNEIITEPQLLRCKNYIPHLEMHFGVDFYSKLEAEMSA
jgi:ATP-dependent exoDNAse (exonuclease V) beta subunit